jgi:hypothetical protein
VKLNKNAVELSMNLIIIAAIGLLILLIVAYFFINNSSQANNQIYDCTARGGICAASCDSIGSSTPWTCSEGRKCCMSTKESAGITTGKLFP